MNPIFLANRDEGEVKITIEEFEGKKKDGKGVELIHLRSVDDVEKYLSEEGGKPGVAMIVGAIPGEKAVCSHQSPVHDTDYNRLCHSDYPQESGRTDGLHDRDAHPQLPFPTGTIHHHVLVATSPHTPSFPRHGLQTSSHAVAQDRRGFGMATYRWDPSDDRTRTGSAEDVVEGRCGIANRV
jgi:hypothetical protein